MPTLEIQEKGGKIPGSLRQDSLLHDVGEGVEDALADVSFQRGVEIGNDLEETGGGEQG